MSVSFLTPNTGHKAEAMAFGSRMEAAAEALLRIRDEVVATLDRQVIELQQIHHALAFAPPPMIVTKDSSRPLIPEAAPSRIVVTKPSLFEDAPRFPMAPLVPVVQGAKAMSPMRAQMHSQCAEIAGATMEDVGVQFSEPMLDPMLERATLEELNDALASAFAMVSSRSEC